MRTERLRHEDLQGIVDRLPDHGSEGALALYVQITSGNNYPTLPQSYFFANPILVTGDESEGSAGTLTLDPTQTFLVFNLGPLIPTIGTQMLAHRVGGRWCIGYG
jgi:hypothetical protein